MTTQIATNLLFIIGGCLFVIAFFLAIIYAKARADLSREDIDPYNGDGF